MYESVEGVYKLWSEVLAGLCLRDEHSVVPSLFQLHRGVSEARVGLGLGKADGKVRKNNSDTGNRTPGYRVRGDNVSHYTISDMTVSNLQQLYSYAFWVVPRLPSLLSKKISSIFCIPLILRLSSLRCP